MGGAGTLTYNTNIDTKGFQKGINDITDKTKSGGTKMKTILGSLGIAKLVETAFNMIRNSMDGAISRLDTMNNFPKVMSNLGISAKDSQKAIDKLTQGLRGLPTTLDAGALSVQRFTSKNGDVNKSTEYFLALNNAILAGGASSEIQSSAIEQLSQSYAKGKPDMMEWRSIMTAMPAQLKQVAIAMGYIDADALGEDLREGNVSMEEFMETLVRLDKEGTANFKSFQEQAKNATGGIRTNITNMKTAIARGVANIINSLDKALKKANLKGVGDSIKALGETFENALKKIAKAISKVDFKALLNVLKALVPVIGSVVAGFVAYNTVLNVINGINIVKNILSATSALLGLTSATNLSAGAMAIFNTIMSANPIGLAVAGITAFTVGLGLLLSKLKDTDSAQEKYNSTMKEYNAKMKEAEQARQEYLDTNMNELSYYEQLGNELKNLTDANGRVKEGYEERANFIVTTLNEALGTELKITDGVIENYNELQDSIRGVIEEKRAQYLLDAQEQKYNTAKDQRNKLEEAYNEAVKNNQRAIKEKNDLEKDLMKTYGLTKDQLDEIVNTTDTFNNELGLTPQQIMNIRNELLKVNGDIEKSDRLLSDNAKTYTENEKIIAEYENALGFMSDKNYEAVLKMYEDTTNYIGKTDKATYDNYQVAIDRQQNYLDRLRINKFKYDEETFNTLVSNGEAQLNELKAQQEKYKSAVEEGQEKQKNAVSEGQKKVNDEVKKGMDKQLETANSRKDAFGKSGSNNMLSYQNGISSQKENVNSTTRDIGNSAVNQLDKSNQAYTTGQNLSRGFSNGINSLAGSINRVASALAQNAVDAMQRQLDIHSPSKKTKEIGINFDKGFIGGIEDEGRNVYKTIDTFGDEILDRFSNAVNMETGKMSFNGTTGSVNQMLSANATFEGVNENNVYLDGEKIYENQQKIIARKNLQYGGVR